jgi:hypothetical protein
VIFFLRQSAVEMDGRDIGPKTQIPGGCFKESFVIDFDPTYAGKSPAYGT